MATQQGSLAGALRQQAAISGCVRTLGEMNGASMGFSESSVARTRQNRKAISSGFSMTAKQVSAPTNTVVAQRASVLERLTMLWKIV